MSLDFKSLHHKLVIVSSSKKKELLKLRKQHPEVNFKMLDKQEFIEKLSFKYDDRAIIYLHRLGLPYQNTKEILNSMFFLKRGVSNKVDELIKLREELLKQGLLQNDKLFLESIKNKEIIIINYLNDPELQYLGDLHHLTYTYVDDEIKLEHFIYEFNSLNDEIRFIFEKIGQWLTQNINPSKIKLVVNNETYLQEVKKYSIFYQIPFNFKPNLYFDKSEDFRLFLTYLETMIADEAFSLMKEKIHYQKAFDNLFDKYIRVKDYLNENEIKEYLIFVASKTPIEDCYYEEAIEVCSLEECDENEYVILPGFILGSYPNIVKDIDYLSDKEKIQLNRITSYDKQKQDTFNIRQSLSNLKNVYISYSKNNDKEKYYLSRIAINDHFEILKYEFSNIIYSKKHFELMMGKILDDYYNFSYLSPYIESCTKDDINYHSYNHQFSPISFISPSTLKLSFTGIQTFYKCPFQYYMHYIIKADDFEDNIYSKIGNMMHYLLESEVKGNGVSFEELLSKYDLTSREKTLINGERDQIYYVLDHFKNWKKDSSWNEFIAESSSYTYPLMNQVILEGKIDLIAKKDHQFAIIDYKTSDYKFNPDLVPLGFDLQLPLYSLLVKAPNSSLKEDSLIGLYIHTILSKNYYRNDFKYLLFDGVTLLEDGFSLMENNLQYLKKNRNNNVLFDNERFEELQNISKELAIEAANKIRNGEFIIQPKIIDNNNMSCENCSFKDVCYHDYHDNLYLKKAVKK